MKKEAEFKLQSSDDFFEQGATDEESGDRWLGSDIAKALRFYQKAYNNYLIASKKPIEDPNLKIDIYYNISRLLYHVYNHYFQTDGVDVRDLSNVDEVLLAEDSVVQELPAIINYHRITISMNEQTPLVDLLYNTGLVLTQIVENLSDLSLVIEPASEARELFQTVLKMQVNLLQKFIAELDGLTEETVSEGSGNEEAMGETVLQPPDVFETIISCYSLVGALLENVSDPEREIEIVKLFSSTFIESCDTIANELVSNFSSENNSKPDFVSSIPETALNQYKITKVYIASLFENNIDSLYNVWNNNLPQIAEVPEKYLVFVDSIQEFLDRNDVNLVTCKNNQYPVEVYWQCLTNMGNYLKKAQELCNVQKQEIQKLGGDNLGTLLATISNIYIKRCDIELQRSNLREANRDILLQNSKVFLKSAINVAKLSGGLRERATEKFVRQQRQVDAMVKLGILENKTATEIGLDGARWEKEMAQLASQDYFDHVGVNYQY